MPPRPTPLRLEGPRHHRRRWTTALVEVADRRSRTGDLSLLGELCDALLGDDRIPAVLRTRTQSLFGVVPTFEASGDGRRKNRAVNALEAQDDWWAIAPESECSLILEYGLLAGVAPAQLNGWERVGARDVVRKRHGRNVSRLEHWSVSRLRFDFETHGWHLDIGAHGEELVPFFPGNGQDALFTPFTDRSPWLHGFWRGMAPWFLLKTFARDDWSRSSEATASMAVESDAEVESTKEMRQALADSVAQLTRDGVIALPPGFSIKLIENYPSSHLTFQEQIKMADEAIAIAGLGHNLTTQVSGGSLAAANVGNDVRLDLRKFDAETFSTFVHDQVLTPWAETNYGDGALAPWPIYAVEPPEDRAAKAAELKVLGEAISALPEDVDKRQILEDFDIPLISPEAAQAIRDANVAMLPGAAPDPEAEPEEPEEPAALRRVRLATSTPSGPFVAGQHWVNGLVDAATILGQRDADGALQEVIQAAQRSTSFDDLRMKLIVLAAEAPTPEAVDIFERAILLAVGRGTYSASLEVDADP